MNTNLQSQEAQQEGARDVANGRIKLIGLFAVALVPLFLAMTMYFGGWNPSSFSNKGTLIVPPIDLSSILPENQRSEFLSQYTTDGKWALMMTLNGPCTESCKEHIHLIRQINIAMGRESERIQRYLVYSEKSPADPEWSEKYPRLSQIQSTSNVIDSFTTTARSQMGKPIGGSVPESYLNLWIADPLGNVILNYREGQSGYDLIDDLKRVLKLSKIG